MPAAIQHERLRSGKATLSQPKILIVSDVAAEASMIGDVLLNDFSAVLTSLGGPSVVEKFQSALPDVLVLGFAKLTDAETQYLAIWRGAKDALHAHRALVLCKTSEVRQAYALCMRGIFDDYVQYWPMSLDPMRLAMSVRIAYRGLEAEHLDALSNQRKPGPDTHCPTGRGAESSITTILVVDDDALQRNLVATILRDQGYRLIFASNGVEALEAMQRKRPDVVLLDVMMPEMDGAETIRQMKVLDEFSAIPVVMMAGDSRGATVKSTIAAGARDFLVKPVVGSVLIEKLRRALMT